MKEAYVSFEVAKLLKEKGFDEPCRSYFINDGGYRRCTVEITNKDCTTEQTLRPTHQMAIAWLRNKHYIYADPIKQGNYNDCSEYYTFIVARMGIIHRNSTVADKLSYEQAVEAALKYSLENLVKETEK